MPRSFSHNLILLDFTTVFSVLVVIVSISEKYLCEDDVFFYCNAGEKIS